MDRKERNVIVGKRLDECIKRKNISRSQLIKEVEAKYPKIVITRGNISNYIHGTSISRDRKEAMAQILDVDVGYFLGDDNFLCTNYSSYKRNNSVTKILEEVSGNICDNFCKYRDTCDDNCECEWIRQGNECPLDKLY